MKRGVIQSSDKCLFLQTDSLSIKFLRVIEHVGFGSTFNNVRDCRKRIGINLQFKSHSLNQFIP